MSSEQKGKLQQHDKASKRLQVKSEIYEQYSSFVTNGGKMSLVKYCNGIWILNDLTIRVSGMITKLITKINLVLYLNFSKGQIGRRMLSARLAQVHCTNIHKTRRLQECNRGILQC
jgi:hypothetical protein